MRRVWVYAFCVVLCVSGCAHTPDTLFEESGAEELTDRDMREIESGQRIHNEIVSRHVVFDHPQIVSYVQEIGSSLLLHAERKNLPYAFTILQDERIYATVAPGGHVYITTGFILLCANEAELAAVIAHEIAQAQYRLPDPRIKDTLNKLRPVAAMALGMFLGPYGSLAVMGVDLAGYWATLEKSRAARTIEADHDGMMMMLNAGYDPQGMIDIFYAILSKAKEDIVKLYNYHQSHPISDARFEALITAYETCDLAGKTFSTGREEFLVQTDPLRELFRR